jgi:Methylamine utilisation protein MauE
MLPGDFVMALRILAALVFVTAAAGKMRHWLAFQGVVANYRLLPEGLILPVARALPVAEFVIGGALLTRWSAPGAEVAAAALLAVFGLAMGVNILRGRPHIDCGCFQSTLKQTLRWRLVARNAALAALLVVDLASPTATPDAWSAVNGALGGVALFIVWQGLNTLWAIVPAFGRPRAPAHAHSEEST